MTRPRQSESSIIRVFPLVAIILIVVAAVPRGQSRQTDTGFLDRNVVISGVIYRFQVYIPLECAPDKSWPILVDLHGNGAQGDDGVRQTAHFLADQVRLGFATTITRLAIVRIGCRSSAIRGLRHLGVVRQ
jgi:hypothetical protein